MTPLRLAFMGSPAFSVPTLEALIAAGHSIASVYTQPPRPAGRGKKLTVTPVHACAEAEGLDVRTPKSLRSEDAQQAFTALDLDAAVVIAYGLILPQAILDAPRHGCMNLHASLLPRWRGAAPIQRAIMAGDTLTGVQAMVMEAGLDTGPVLATETARIFAFDTSGDLHERLAGLAADLAPRAIEGLVDGSLVAQAQPDEGITYADKITADDRPIDWSRPAREVDAQIRGLSPAPGAVFEWTPDGATTPLKMKALLSEHVQDVDIDDAVPGTVIDPSLLVLCGDGEAIRLRKLQKPGAKTADAEDFLRGTPIPPGTRLA